MHKEHEDVVNVMKGEVSILNPFYALLYVKKILLACTKNKFGFLCVFSRLICRGGARGMPLYA